MENINDEYQLRYLVMPDFLFKRKDISLLSIKIYCFIHSFKGERFFFSNEHLGKMFDVYPTRVSESITQLAELDLITTEYEMKAGGGRIRFIKDCNSNFRKSGSTTSATTDRNGIKVNDIEKINKKENTTDTDSPNNEKYIRPPLYWLDFERGTVNPEWIKYQEEHESKL